MYHMGNKKLNFYMAYSYCYDNMGALPIIDNAQLTETINKVTASMHKGGAYWLNMKRKDYHDDFEWKGLDAPHFKY